MSAMTKQEAAALDAHRLRVYHEQPTDYAAARVLGLSRPGFRSWRTRKMLPTKNPTAGGLASIEEQKRLAAYAVADTDEEGGELCGIARPAFRIWRNSRGLPSKGGWGGNRQVTKSDTAKRQAAYDAGLWDEAIAEAAGCTAYAVTSWRRRRRLPVNRKPRELRRSCTRVPYVPKIVMPGPREIEKCKSCGLLFPTRTKEVKCIHCREFDNE